MLKAACLVVGVLLVVRLAHAQADGVVIATRVVSYHDNAGGCPDGRFGYGNPYHCVNLAPGPIHLAVPPGKYRAVRTSVFSTDDAGGVKVWVGDANGGTQYDPAPGPVDFDVTVGEITLYYHDWYPFDNPAGIGSIVEVRRLDCAQMTVPALYQDDPQWAMDTFDHAYRFERDTTSQSVSQGGVMTLALFDLFNSQANPPSQTRFVDLTDPGKNNLIGLKNAINALAITNVTATVATDAETHKPYLQLRAPGYNAVQLRDGVDFTSRNVLHTIKRSGCLLTSAVMLINYYARLQNRPGTNPRELNEWLNYSNGYLGSNLRPAVIPKFAREVKDITMSYAGTTGWDDSTVNSYLCSGNPVILQVVHPTANTLTNHFVLATGRNAGAAPDDFRINDPGRRNNTSLQPYGGYLDTRLFKTTATDPSILNVVAHSPVELLVTNPDGLRTGSDPSEGLTLREIAGATYQVESLGDDEDTENGAPTPPVKVFELLMPPAGVYNVGIRGTASGDYTIDIMTLSRQDALAKKTITGSTVAGALATISIDYDSAADDGPVVMAPCAADVDGNGRVDAADLNLIRAAMGTRATQAEFNASADLNHDGVISVIDLAFASRSQGCATQRP